MRYLTSFGEWFDDQSNPNKRIRGMFRYVYDLKYKSFVAVEKKNSKTQVWEYQNFVSELFYVQFPAFGTNNKEQDHIPRWAKQALSNIN